jgi:hypothetical protein
MRPAVWRFGASCLVLAGCAREPAPRTAMVDNRGRRDFSGPYWCSIDEGGHPYPRFPCVIRRQGQQYVLAKLAGSQRFRGEIEAVPGGFEFRGELYCPYGDCTQPLHGRFEQRGNELRGTFADSQLIVHLLPASDAAFGGIAYGGAGDGNPGAGQGYGATMEDGPPLDQVPRNP